MLLLIWSIYVIIAGRYRISKTFGIKGPNARLFGFFTLFAAVALNYLASGGLDPSSSLNLFRDPVGNILVGEFIIPIILIISLAIVAVAIYGNDFGKPKETLKESIDSSAFSYCPKCKSNYREGFTICEDCGVDLIPYDK
jgi:hypothetical protein